MQPISRNVRSHQTGVATLAISLILLSLVTMVTIYANRAGIQNLLTSANKTRSEEARLAGEQLIDQVMAYLSMNRQDIRNWQWTTCADSETAGSAACRDTEGALVYSPAANWQVCELTNVDSDIHNCCAGTGCTMSPNPNLQIAHTGERLYLITPAPNQLGNASVFDIVAVGHSADGTATTHVRQGTMFNHLGAGKIPIPIMGNQLPSGGNFSVVANPNGAGTGNPLSIWTRNSTTFFGSTASCQIDEFLRDDSTHVNISCGDTTITGCPDCNCNAAYGTLSDAGKRGVDIIDSSTLLPPTAPAYPTDLFAAVFGVPTSQADVIRAEARKQNPINTCASLNTASHGLIWIDGTCNLPSNDIGSADHPVILVVNGDTQLNGKINFYGVIFAFSSDPTISRQVQLVGSPTNYGAILSNTDITFSGGNFKMRYEKCILDNLSRDNTDALFGKIPGSWIDY